MGTRDSRKPLRPILLLPPPGAAHGGGGGGGKIVGISSVHGPVAKAKLGPYCATKVAINMFSKQLAVWSLAPTGAT